MIPVSLKIKGLYSFQEEQVIDFANLIDAQIFGIFGTVGSGKSTILEAISFALFGNTERLNSRDNRNYNMMNLKSDKLLIDFVFTNFDNELYRFVVEGKRHNSEFSKVSSFTRSAYHQQDGNWIPIGSITAEGILGLSYENFRRTIIIPQGQFKEFLELGDKDRTNMLKELFHLGKYDFFYQTTSLEKRNNEKIQFLNGQLAQYEHTTAENIAQKAVEVQALATELSTLKVQLENAKSVEKEQSDLKKIFEDLASKKKILSDLTLQEPKITAQESTLGRYESCVQLFKNQLNSKKEVEGKLKEKKSTLEDTELKFQDNKTALETAQQSFAQLEPEFKNLDQKRQEIEDYKQWNVVRKLVVEIDSLVQRTTVGEQKLNAENATRQALQAQVAAGRKQIQESRAALPNLAELAEVSTWFAQKNNILKNLSTIASEKKGIESSLQEKAKSMQIPESLAESLAFDPEEKMETWIEKLENQKKLNETKAEAIAGFNNHLLLQEKLEEYTQDLEEGKPCPLCGSTHHPEIMSVENVLETRKANDDKLENVRRQNALIEQTILQLNENLYAQKALLMQVQASAQRMEAEEKNLKDHLEAFKWLNFDREDQDAFNAVFEKSKTASRHIESLEKEVEKLEVQLQAAELNFEKYSKLLQEIKDQLTVKNTEKETISTQIKLIDKDPSLEENALKERISTLEKHVLSVTENYETLSRKIIDQNQQKVVLQERMETTQRLVNEDKQQLEKLDAELASNLAKSAFSDLNEINELLQQELDIPALREEIKEFHQQFFKSKADVSELDKQVQGKDFSAEKYAELLSQLQQLASTVQSKHDFHVTETAVLEKLKTDFTQKSILLQDMENLRKRAENINMMKSLFKGSGFVNYISTVYLQNLCEMANVRFYKLTRQQLRLEVSESNDFQVRDYLNNGKIRSIKTLSGGQIFQAALSLALALAESIQQQNKAKQNFFFLDEGFGSQDKLSLQIVFDSLKALREENRVIGVISHVEDLQQEIDMYLKLENDPETGSKIEQSWEK